MTHYQVNFGNKIAGRIAPGIQEGGGYLAFEGDWGMIVGFGDTKESAVANIERRFDKEAPLTVIAVSKKLRRAVDPEDIHSLEFQLVRCADGSPLAVEPSETAPAEVRAWE